MADRCGRVHGEGHRTRWACRDRQGREADQDPHGFRRELRREPADAPVAKGECVGNDEASVGPRTNWARRQRLHGNTLEHTVALTRLDADDICAGPSRGGTPRYAHGTWRRPACKRPLDAQQTRLRVRPSGCRTNGVGPLWASEEAQGGRTVTAVGPSSRYPHPEQMRTGRLLLP